MSLIEATQAAHAARTAEKIAVNRTTRKVDFAPGIVFDDGKPVEMTVTSTSSDIVNTPAAWNDYCADNGLTIPAGYRAVLVEAKQDPAAWTRDSTEQELAVTRDIWRLKFRIEPDTKTVTADDREILTLIERQNRKPAPKRKTSAGLRVILGGDGQLGKVDQNGGTTAFFARHDIMMGKLGTIIQRTPCDDSLWVDPGDLLEGFENTGAQAHTNDLSLPKQMQTARAYLTSTLTFIASRHKRTRAITVPSNHAAWRSGKSYLGTPGDDFGIDTYRAVAETLAATPTLKERLSIILPADWDVSMAVTVPGGKSLGLTHGDKGAGSPDRIPDWWTKQAFGDQPTAAVDYLITGHFHHFQMREVTKGRWWIQAPPLDGGSAWISHSKGVESTPGMVTFIINDDGSWSDLHIITAD